MCAAVCVQTNRPLCFGLCDGEQLYFFISSTEQDLIKWITAFSKITKILIEVRPARHTQMRAHTHAHAPTTPSLSLFRCARAARAHTQLSSVPAHAQCRLR
jgi:hypothetical protein